MAEGQPIQWLTDKRTTRQTMIYNTLPRTLNKGNNKITELRTILQRESQYSQVYKQTKSVNNRKTVKY